MRALDTNILVRYLVNDDPAQAAVADRILDDCRRKREPVFLSILVLCEMVWVLARSFDQSKSEIVEVLERILDLDLFRVEREPLVPPKPGTLPARQGKFRGLPDRGDRQRSGLSRHGHVRSRAQRRTRIPDIMSPWRSHDLH